MARNHRTRGTCTFPDCGRPHVSRGYCKGHYTQLDRGQPLRPLGESRRPKVCAFPGCGRKHAARGYCAVHAAQIRKGKQPTPIPVRTPRGACETPGCGRPHLAKGLCKTCYNRARSGIRQPAAGEPVCRVDGCGRGVKTDGLCNRHDLQRRRGTLGARTGNREGIHTPVDKPARPAKGASTARSARKPSKLPKGWNRPLPAERPRTLAPAVTNMDLGPVPPLNREVAERAVEVLRSHDALDLLDVLGLGDAA